MLSISRLAISRAQSPRIALPLAFSAAPPRLFSQDAAGPSRISYKKMQRRSLRESVATGRTTTLTDLSFLEDNARPPPPRQSTPPRYDRSDGLPPRFNSRRDRDVFYRDKKASEAAARREGNAPKAQSPFVSSDKVKKWMSRHESPLTPKQVDEVIAMVADLPRESVNASVWNLVLGLLGREGKYAVMWKTYNQMKKRGVYPTSRTFTTLLNAYAGISHDAIPAGQFTPMTRPEKLTLDRVRLIYEQSQQHIGMIVRKSQPPAETEDTGLAATASAPEFLFSNSESAPEVDTTEVNVSPTNAYLKFLGRFGLWEEMKRVMIAMDRDGPLAPTQVTYTTVFLAANNLANFARTNPDEAKTLPEIDIGPTAKMYWDQAVRQLCNPENRDPSRKLDEELALTALQCLAIGRPADQRLAEELIAELWDLPSPNAPKVASSDASSVGEPAGHLQAMYPNLPRFRLSVRSATTIMGLLTRLQNSTTAAFFTHAILDTRRLQPDFDLPALRTAVYNFANARDIDAVLSVMDQYQPPSGRDGWPIDVWHAALRAARWSADWDAAQDLFRRMVHLPPGVMMPNERQAAAGAGYMFKPPNKQRTDIRGRAWVAPAAHPADAVAMATLVKTGVACGLRQLRMALNVVEHYGEEHWWLLRPRSSKLPAELDLLAPPPADVAQHLSKAQRRALADRVELARDLEHAVERLLVVPRDDAEKERLTRMQQVARAVVRNYAEVVKDQGVVRPATRAQHTRKRAEQDKLGLQEGRTPRRAGRPPRQPPRQPPRHVRQNRERR